MYRNSINSSACLHHESIDSNASFFKENLKEIIRKNHQNPERINLWFAPAKYTLMPSTIFLPSKAENYFQLNFGKLNSNEQIYFESIISLGLVVVYAIPNWLVELKSEINIFGGIKAIISKQLNLLDKNKELNLIECITYEGCMDVCIKSNGKLLLANQYEIENENDLVYFLLLIKKKLNLEDNLITNITKVTSNIENESIKNLIESIQDFNQIQLVFSDSESYYNNILCE